MSLDARQLRRKWRRERRQAKRAICSECGYPARMHPDARWYEGWDGPAWRTVDPDHRFVRATQEGTP